MIPNENENYLIVCRKENAFRGNDLALFWRPESKGYTPDIDQAGRYTRKEAFSIVASCGKGEHEAVRESDVLGKSRRLLELCSIPPVKLGEVYWCPERNMFVQPRYSGEGWDVVCGDFCHFFNDAQTTTAQQVLTFDDIRKMRHVPDPAEFDGAELSSFGSWCVKGYLQECCRDKPEFAAKGDAQ